MRLAAAGVGATALGAAFDWGWRRGLRRTATPTYRPEPGAVQLVTEAEALSPTTKDGFSAILAKCHAALELDSRYAPAHAVLANAYRESAWHRAERDAMIEARRAARRAVELDPRLVRARTQLALILLLSDWDFPGAEAQFQAGLKLEPFNLGPPD